MPPLADSEAICEIWQSPTVPSEGHSGHIRYRCDADTLFGVIELSETDFAGGVPLQDATETAYRQIAILLDNLGFPYVMRYWNYMADINTETHRLERYRQFNLGRQTGLRTQGKTVEGNVPAACALGTAHGNLNIAFLAGRIPLLAIENPRQVSAYAYPQSYGPRSPSFSRASLVSLSGQAWLFISGTASIVGHASVHLDDVRAQTRETLLNIITVLRQANQYVGHNHFDFSRLQFKIYVRHDSDSAAVREEFDAITGGSPDAVYLRADICRKELLVEIEATSRPVLIPTIDSELQHV